LKLFEIIWSNNLSVFAYNQLISKRSIIIIENMGCCGSKKPEELPQPAQEGTQEKEVLEGMRDEKSNLIVGKPVAGGAFG
jgi:hypothetical protein